MADLIRRSDVIGLLEDMLLFGEYDIIASSFSKADEEKVYRAINDIPAVNRWIPCSERLPEESGCYLVTIKDGEEDSFVLEAWYWKDDILIPYKRHDEKKGWNMLNEWADLTEQMRDKVIAWMTMPDAYEPPEKE